MSADHLACLQRYAERRDPEDFRVLVDAYHGMVYQACWRALRDEQAAMDACQETFLKLARHAGQVSRNLPAWLHTCAVNQARQWLRHETRLQRRALAAGPAIAATAPEDDWAEQRDDLDQALAELPEADRDLLVRRHLRGEDLATIAADLALGVPAVHLRLQRAVERLRDRLRRRGHVLPALALPLCFERLPRPAAPAQVVREAASIGLTGVGPAAPLGLGLIVLATAVLVGGGLVAVLAARHQAPAPWQASTDFSADAPWLVAVACAFPDGQGLNGTSLTDLTPAGTPVIRACPDGGTLGDLAGVIDPSSYQADILALACNRDHGSAHVRATFRMRLEYLEGARTRWFGLGGSWHPGRDQAEPVTITLEPQHDFAAGTWYDVDIEMQRRGPDATDIAVAVDGRPWTTLHIAGSARRLGLLSLQGMRGWIDDLTVSDDLPAAPTGF